jgi:FAD/FMN-containing dehydrogenase/Fe-S oxidoreductase
MDISLKSSTPDIHTDEQTRRLYANDASSYEELPEGVAFPESLQEITEIVRWARKNHKSITARGAGTSLAGQTTGRGIVMDVGRKMNRIIEVNEREKFAKVQPGVIRDTLNRKVEKYNLLFGPDTATTNRCMIGGMIGNNSCGIFSIKHKTTREHILEIDAVLSDGSQATFKPLTETELAAKMELDTLEGHIYREMSALIRKHREQILENYPHPEIIRRNTGYALDRLCEMQPFNSDGRKFNMAELLCGSEGTLAMTASAKLRLVSRDPESIILVPHFSTIRKALEATVKIVKEDPAAVELVDDIILNATKGNIEQRENRFFLDGDPKAILIVQLDGDDPEKLWQKAEKLSQQLQNLGLSKATPIITEKDKMERVWNLRKAGLGLLMGLGSEGRTPTFCEDTAVRVPDLPNYIDDFQKILDKHETDCVFYAHASVGELHLRPVINLQKPEEIEKMKTMAGEIAELVRSYRGSLSGEHGDGRARAPYIEKVLGSEMMPLLKKVKKIWDPENIFNPGKITDPQPMDQDLRYSPSYQKPKVDTHFNWRKEDSFADAVELCNGAGVCRKLSESGGTMCPSYMATKEEKDSTRGRANLFRQLFSGKQKEAFQSEELKDALDLCLSCKACKSECPANVDMAKMKAEFMQGWHKEHGISLSERFFGQAAKLYPLASMFPNVTNWMIKQPITKELLYQFLDIDKRRTLPTFANETFMDWWNNRKNRPVTESTSGQEAVLLIDIFTNYHEPEVGKAAVQFLESRDYRVIIPDFHEVGRPQISKGMLAHAKQILDNNLPKLTTFADQGIPIIGLEPSEILTLRDEYLDLCNEDQVHSAEKVADATYTFEEFAASLLADSPLSSKKNKVFVHGHCHAKSLIGNSAVRKTLEGAGYEVEVGDTGCCGMAGSFGYEANHYEVSMNIGNQRLFPALQNLMKDTIICAPGFSCRHQIKDGRNLEALHPAQLLAGNLS